MDITALDGFGAGRYDLLDYLSLDGVTNDGLVIGDAPAGYNYTIDLSVPEQVDLLVAANAVPEPGAGALLAGGMLLLAAVRRAGGGRRD